MEHRQKNPEKKFTPQYIITIEKHALKSLNRVPTTDRSRMIELIDNLQEVPRPPGCKKLTGRDAWRIRSGDYRIIYEIQDRELKILVVDVGNRREVYR